MKNITNRIVYLIILLLSLGEVFAGDETIPDSLLTKDHVYEFTFSNQSKAKRIIDLMREREKAPEYMLDILEGDLYFNNGKYYLALGYYTRALDSDSVRLNNTDYMEQLHRMISCYDGLHDEVKRMHYVELLLQKAEECNSPEMKSIALFNLGKAIYYQEDKNRGYRYIDEAIDLMKHLDYKYKYDNLRYNYNTLLVMQQRDGLYEDALKTLDDLSKIIEESTEGEPFIEGLDSKERKTMLAHRAIILYRLGRSQEAEQAYQEWKTIGNNYDKDNYLIIPYLFDLKRYDDIIYLNTKREEFLRNQNDTINYYMRAVKRFLGKVYSAKGNYKKAATYFAELSVLTDSLKIREQKSAALEMATLHETHEKTIQIAKQNSELNNRRIINNLAICILVLLLLVIMLMLRNLMNVKRKNRAVIALIHEYQQREKQQERVLVEPVLGRLRENLEDDSEADDRQWIVFNEFRYQMEVLKMYRNPRLTRDEMVALLYTNKNMLISAIQEYTGMGYTEYVNSLRMKEALELLDDPTLTVEIISNRVGFGSTSTFNRQFKAKYDMSPNDYRKNL